MRLFVSRGGWSEMLELRPRSGYAPGRSSQTGLLSRRLLCLGGCLGEDGHPDEAGVWRVEPS